MKGWHFLRENMKAGWGDEPAWQVGEERHIEGEIALCRRGYHYSSTPFDALRYAPGPVLCLVEVDQGEEDEGKGVSPRRRLLRAVDVWRELRIFAADCAERALQRERDAGREPDQRSWDAVDVARQYIQCQVGPDILEAAKNAAWDAAWDAEEGASFAARGVARDTALAAMVAAAASMEDACDAARIASARAADAAWAASWAASGDDNVTASWAGAKSAAYNDAKAAVDATAAEAEIAWQRQRLTEMVEPLFTVGEED